MFSKEWKLVALSMLAVSFLTACPGKRNKNAESTNRFQGMWINANAASSLSSLDVAADPRFCHQLNDPETLRRLGLSRSALYGDLVIDAWIIKGNGEVFQYSADSVQTAGFRERYFVGRVSASNFVRKDGMRAGHYYQQDIYSYSAPFARGNAILNLENSQTLTVWAPGEPLVVYSRINSLDQLNRISAALSVCSRGRRHHRPGPQCVGPQCVVGPQGPGPEVGPHQFQPPANFEGMPPK